MIVLPLCRNDLGTSKVDTPDFSVECIRAIVARLMVIEQHRPPGLTPLPALMLSSMRHTTRHYTESLG